MPDQPHPHPGEVASGDRTLIPHNLTQEASPLRRRRSATPGRAVLRVPSEKKVDEGFRGEGTLGLLPGRFRAPPRVPNKPPQAHPSSPRARARPRRAPCAPTRTTSYAAPAPPSECPPP